MSRPGSGWNRPVRPAALVAVGGSLLLLWLALMVGAFVWFYDRYESRVIVTEQPIRLRLPAGLPAMAEVAQSLPLNVSEALSVRVPVKQTMPIKIADAVQANVVLKTTVPISTEVKVTQEVLVSTVAHLHAPIFKWLPSFDIEVPLVLRLPVRMMVPVHTEVPVDLNLHVSGDLSQDLNVPIDSVFELRPQIKEPLQARMQTLTAFALKGPQDPIPMTIERGAVRLPFDLIKFTQSSSEAQLQSVFKTVKASSHH